MTYVTHNIIMLMGTAGFAEGKEENTTNKQEFEAQWATEEMNTGDIVQLLKAIVQGKAIAISDGSFMEQSGAAAWMIEGTTAYHHIVGTGITPGERKDQSAYQSELFGLWGIMQSLKKLIQKHDIIKGE